MSFQEAMELMLKTTTIDDMEHLVERIIYYNNMRF